MVSTAAVASFDPAVLWQRMGPVAEQGLPQDAADTAAAMGYATCHTCDLLVRHSAAGEHQACPRCGSAVHGTRHPDSINRTWALLAAATLLLVPANLLPVMTVIRFGQGEPSTILGGVLHLIESGMWGLALIVFFASIVVPVLKLVVLCYLLWSIRRQSDWRPRDRTLLFRAHIGKVLADAVAEVVRALAQAANLLRPYHGRVQRPVSQQVSRARIEAAHGGPPRQN